MGHDIRASACRLVCADRKCIGRIQEGNIRVIVGSEISKLLIRLHITDIRNILGINTGDRVTFVVEDGTVRVVNSAIYALQRFQAQMKGEGKAAGLMNDDDLAAWITASRREEEAE